VHVAAGMEDWRGAGLYHGELAEGAGCEWAETARRRALDAWTTIAGILQARDPGQALAALETALSHDPYTSTSTRRSCGCWPHRATRNLLMDLEYAGMSVKFVLHDRNAGFTAAFDAVFQASGVRSSASLFRRHV
jgi:hypothetical protein